MPQWNIHAERRERLRRAIRARGLDALLVSSAPNRFYLSGFELHDPQPNESAGRLVIAADGRDWLATDSRYAEAAFRLWERERVVVYKGAGASELAELLHRCGSRLGLESDSVSLAFARALAKARPSLSLEAVDGLVEDLRKIKDAAEIAALEKAFALNHAMFGWVEGELVPGRSEREIAWSVERFFREHGAVELAFPSIVAVGRNAALPHAIPGDDALEDNGLVLIDAGCRVDGYCSDQTRTFWKGERPAEAFSSALRLVREAQDAAVGKMRPGMTFAEAYAIASAVFARAGVAEHFTHGLGHGVGLETHEAPSLSPRASGRLEPGMAVTVEPGLYYPEWGGVRWEYAVLVEEDGVRIL